MIRYRPNKDNGVSTSFGMHLFRDFYGTVAEEFWRITSTGEVISESVRFMYKLTVRETLQFIRETFFKD